MPFPDGSPTPFEVDTARKTGAWADFRNDELRRSTCVECGVLRKYHAMQKLTGRCKGWRTARDDYEWAEWVGVDIGKRPRPPKKPESPWLSRAFRYPTSWDLKPGSHCRCGYHYAGNLLVHYDYNGKARKEPVCSTCFEKKVAELGIEVEFNATCVTLPKKKKPTVPSPGETVGTTNTTEQETTR